MQAIGWVSFGWLTIFYALIAGYFLIRYRLRGHVQSAFIAVLCIWPILYGMSAMGLLSFSMSLAIMLTGGAFGAVFGAVLLDDVRRGGLRKSKGGSHG